MKICIDGLALTHLHGTGQFSYTYEFLDNLFKMYPQPFYEILWNADTVISEWSHNRKIEFVNLPINRRHMDYSILEKHIKESRVDIYHSPNNGFSIPTKKESKNIVTIQDLSNSNYKHQIDKKYHDKFLALIDNKIEKSDVIITVSDFIKNELISCYSIKAEKIKVIYPGYSSQFRPLLKDQCRMKILEKYNIKNDFLLYAGSIHPRKNLHVLFNVLKKILNYDKDIKLILVGKILGKRTEYYEKLKALATRLGINDSVVFTGTIDFKDMPLFYNAALCTFNLSEYEGFPLTALESFACDAPIICTRIPSFEEVLYHNDLLIKVEEINLLADLALEIIRNSSYKNSVINKYKRQVENFNWNLSINKTVRLYESILQSS